jgi:GDP/UDP-N,N'-diacetylbacillosamine 2-epimerase (hydrolysing)
MVAQHGVTEEFDEAASQIEATLQALNSLEMMKIWILPNNDAGSEAVRQAIIKNRRGKSFLFENLKREDYLGFLRGAQALVGNSSAGILEAPTFKIPAVNIGRRQANRIQGKNVLNTDFEVEKILETIKKAVSKEFRETLKDCVNPYGDGKSSERILKILSETPKDSKLLSKTLTY